MTGSFTKYIFCILSLLLTGCHITQQLPIDYMIPAEISFPSTFRRVAIVNNMPSISKDSLLITQQLKKFKNGTQTTTKINQGISVIAAEALAETIAEQHYFDEVVICDSLLCQTTSTRKPHPLTKEEIYQLTNKLDVDFLISIEDLIIKSTHKTIDFGQRIGIQGVVTATVYPTIKIYSPHRENAITTLTCKDSIHWDQLTHYGGNPLEYLIEDSMMIKEASDFAGTLPVKKLLPSWKKSSRSIFTHGSSNMHDAYYFTTCNQWEKAISLWEQEYNNENEKKKMRAAYNLAIGFEIQDNIPIAISWAEKALALAVKIDKKTINRDIRIIKEPTYTLFIQRYINILKQRQSTIPQLKAQMDRFNMNE